MTPTSRRSPPVAVATAATSVLLMAGMALWPPARGAMMLVPIRGDTAAAANAAVAAGAALLAPGPLPGSLIVRGERDRLGREALRHEAVLFAAPALLCGSAG